MSGLFNQLKRNRVWSVGVYADAPNFSFQDKPRSLKFVLDAKKIRKPGRHIHTFADPFLFPFEDELFLFYETQAAGGKGRIEAVKTTDLNEFVHLGEILAAPFHLSYPFVFECGSSVFMLPESYAGNEVALYKFEEFPNKLIKSRVLLDGGYWDSSVIKHDGLWYLFTTSTGGLEIYYADDLENGTLTPHPLNPITKDPRYRRCGGSPLVIKDKLYRIAQDGSGEYGKNIHVLRINKLSETEYNEELVRPDYFDHSETWNSQGGHHFSLARFKGKSIIAVDGKQNDYLLNKLLALIYKF